MNTNESALVHSVTEVSLSTCDSDVNGKALIIAAAGEVSSTGWKNPGLSAHVYVQPPPDGIWGFSFSADPPEGTSRPVVTPIEATYFMAEFPEGLQGVRVFAETNSVEARLI